MNANADPPFFFMHVMKTGGTSFVQQVMVNFAPEEVYPLRGMDRGERVRSYSEVEYLRRLPPALRRRIRVYTAHLPFVASALIEPAPIVLTLLRDPVERTISVLRHCKRGFPSHNHLSLEEVYEDGFIFPTLVQDHQAKLFCLTAEDEPESTYDMIEVDDRRLNRACENLERVDVLGLTERYGEFVETMRSRYGWRTEQLPDQRVSEEGWEASPELRRRIAADNAADVEFYDYARKLYERRRRG